MALNREKLANLLEYFGVRSPQYFLSRLTAHSDPDDPLAYHLDMSPLAAYDGPVDDAGLPVYAPLGGIHIPVTVLNWALGQFECFRTSQTEHYLDTSRKTAQWLVDTQEDDGTWRHPVAKPDFGLGPGSPSAMIQGLAMSFLVRVHRVVGDDHLLAVARRALESFRRETGDGGVTTHHDEGPFFEEYPGEPPCHVLNGALFAMYGLWDLAEFADSSEARTLWYQGLATLIAWLPRYDLGYWSLYHLPESPANPATVKYHELHVEQLRALYTITGDQTFRAFADRWAGYLGGRTNALRTLPAKFRWLRQSKRQSATAPTPD